ncbi:MAG TPA: Ryanodine receptor Ryr [Lachnospiraceae bacterium]|nr:RyR domain-containing protein [uncultured Lachnoclostridium sp.]HAU86545.1 Ryanodine receptor Ryr [Lachnospiraceae bacterium]
MEYNPKPIDISNIEIDNELNDLLECLAKNSHDMWAQRRISDGWTLGDKRDDERKRHPGLIPYERLPESEKEYDRISVVSTLKAIIALGYKIQK